MQQRLSRWLSRVILLTTKLVMPNSVSGFDPFAAVAQGHVDLVQAESQDVVLRAGAGRQKSHTLQVEIVEVPPGGVSAAEDFWGRAEGSTGREGALKHEGPPESRRVRSVAGWEVNGVRRGAGPGFAGVSGTLKTCLFLVLLLPVAVCVRVLLANVVRDRHLSLVVLLHQRKVPSADELDLGILRQ